MSKSTTEILQLMNAGVTAALNEAGNAVGCADLAWCVDASWSTLVLSGSAVGMYADAAVPDVLKAWGQMLRLDEVPKPAVAGTRQMSTCGRGLTVSVSGVVDTPAYLADGEAWMAAQDPAEPTVTDVPAGQVVQVGDDAAAYALTDTGLFVPDGYPTADEVRAFDDVTPDAPGAGEATTSTGAETTSRTEFDGC